jgi:hypothetical protein
VAEISENRIRGQLGSLFILIHNLGILLAFVAGNYLSYKLVGAMMITLPVLFFVSFLFLPETPQYLLKQRKVKVNEKNKINSFFKFQVTIVILGSRKIIEVPSRI